MMRSPPRALLLSWLALLALLSLTVFVSYQPLGVLNTGIALAIALGKALIVAVIFMELSSGNRLKLAAAGAGLFWIAIMLWLTLADCGTRPDFHHRVSTSLSATERIANFDERNSAEFFDARVVSLLRTQQRLVVLDNAPIKLELLACQRFELCHSRADGFGTDIAKPLDDIGVFHRPGDGRV